MPKYKITLTVGDIVKEVEISNANEIDLSSLGFEEKDGYALVWYVNGEEYDFSTPITSDMQIEGKYVKETVITVKFDSKGGSKVASQTVKSGEKAKEPTDVTYEGFIFEGWYLNNNKYDFSTPVTKSIKLIAKWSEDPNVKRYTITFDSNGGSKVNNQRIIENKKATKPKNPTRSGYSFVEWQLDNKKYDFNSKVTKDIKLVAKWEEDIKYTVTFDSNGGSKVASQTVNNGGKVKKPSNPTKSGYTFVEWLYKNQTFDFNKVITENITLTATYKKNVVVTPIPAPKEYTITATKADNYSPDSILKVYENGKQIAFRCIKFTDNVIVDGSKSCRSQASKTMNALTSDIAGEKEFIVILSSGSSVKAKLK